ncbi:hypothetical protein M758_10G043100 [Ceratodon purpureus]|nr:hypothetical protein M758_10G043100 [Ceratodon purpureus]
MAQMSCLVFGSGFVMGSGHGRRDGGLARFERVGGEGRDAVVVDVRRRVGRGGVRCEMGGVTEPVVAYGGATLTVPGVEVESGGNAVVVAHEGFEQLMSAARPAGVVEEEEHAWVAMAEPVTVEKDLSNLSSSSASAGVSSNGGVMVAEDALSAEQLKQASASKGGMRWNMLLSTEALEDAHLFRASSVTDAHVLRRKGRLKEQDGLIEFIISMHATHSPFQVMEKVERWVREHVADPKRSTLNRLIPHMGPRFHTPLPLVRALNEYDEFASLSRRKYVPPNFAEVRHVLNIAQVHAIAEKLSLITFDADGTIYADGHHIEGDNKMIGHIIKLMREGIQVAIVTAAGYPGNASKFEGRLAGLLEAFKELQLPPHIRRLFHVMGGECNYLLHVNSEYRLEFVPDELWKSPDMLAWGEDEVKELLDNAERSLKSAAARLRVPIDIIRKPRAVGAVPKDPTIYEVLEEMALTVQVQLMQSGLPFCAFNGGNDVFVDVGNKSVGLRALMKYLNTKCCETLHVGDRFTVSGNDMATRSQCSILWVANPEETAFFARLLLRDIRLAKLNQYIE